MTFWVPFVWWMLFEPVEVGGLFKHVLGIENPSFWWLAHSWWVVSSPKCVDSQSGPLIPQYSRCLLPSLKLRGTTTQKSWLDDMSFCGPALFSGAVAFCVCIYGWRTSSFSTCWEDMTGFPRPEAFFVQRYLKCLNKSANLITSGLMFDNSMS